MLFCVVVDIFNKLLDHLSADRQSRVSVVLVRLAVLIGLIRFNQNNESLAVPLHHIYESVGVSTSSVHEVKQSLVFVKNKEHII